MSNRKADQAMVKKSEETKREENVVIDYTYDRKTGQATVEISKETAKILHTAIVFFEKGFQESNLNIGENSMSFFTFHALRDYFMSGMKIDGSYIMFLNTVKAKIKELLEI